MSSPPSNRTEERFARGRRARYAADPPPGVITCEPQRTTLDCEACGRGVWVIVGAQAGRPLLQCDYCARLSFHVSEQWRPRG